MKTILLSSMIILLTGCGRSTDYTYYPVETKVPIACPVKEDQKTLQEVFYQGCLAAHKKPALEKCAKLTIAYFGGAR